MSEDLTCHVCAQVVTDLRLLADCDNCRELYHLNPRSDVEGIDCGNVWVGSGDSLALQFSCQPCIDGPAAELAEPAEPAEAAATPAPAAKRSSQPPPLTQRRREPRRFRRVDA